MTPIAKIVPARLPQCLAIEAKDDEVLMVLEDLDEAGYPLRKNSLTWEEIASCLAWLAKFHVSYLGKTLKRFMGSRNVLAFKD